MHATTQATTHAPTDTTAEQRRRRHLSVYHRALRSAQTPAQRAAVATRYRKLFAATADVSSNVAVDAREADLAETIQLPVPQPTVRLAS